MRPPTSALKGLFLLFAAGCASTPRSVSEPKDVSDLLPTVQAASARFQVPVPLILAVIEIESSFRPDARSQVGACGLMQLMPQTAAELARVIGWNNYNIYDPAFNVQAGTAYLSELIERFDGHLGWALTAYHGGPGRALRIQRRTGQLPPDSARYAQAILAARTRYEDFSGTTPRELHEQPNEAERAALRNLLRQQLELEEVDDASLRAGRQSPEGLGRALVD